MKKIETRRFRLPRLGEDLSEAEALTGLVDAFAGKMKTKLLRKLERGYGGWASSDFTRAQILARIKDELDKADPDPVDIANYAAMLWNIIPAETMSDERGTMKEIGHG